LAEPGFDLERFDARLETRRLGRMALVHERTGSTNDDAWQAHGAGAPDGFTVVARDQTRGRGRAGRSWHTAAGKGLALSVLLRDGGGPALGVTPLLAGLALVHGFERLGVEADLKWPNDVLLHERKLAGVLVESRSAERSGGRAVVIGVGVNVAQAEEDFPPGLRATATSLAREGRDLPGEDVAAAFLNALEPLWDEFGLAGPGPLLAACRARGSFWGRAVRVVGPAGGVAGIAQGLDDEGRLLVALDAGGTVVIVAGDVEIVADAGRGAAPGAAVER
jgi:BirA family biotin operon repressor/biotin-[acetyl-CoA-carboxylase] ligase